jgi:MerR family redox-sensitive transcriptional activator SoxR
MRANDTLTIGELARRTGLTVSAIRFYEAKKLIEPLRTGGNQRRFLRADIRRLSFILIAQRLGLSLSEIAGAIENLPHGRTPTAGDWLQISRSLGNRIDNEIARLQKVRDTLGGCIGCGCLSLEKCALYNTDDVWGRTGSGPRVLR